MSKRMCRLGAAMLAGLVGAATLSGCSSSEEQAEELEEAMVEAAEELEDEAAEAEEEEEELTDEEILEAQLVEGEQVLLDSSSVVEAAFDTEVPDLEVEIPEGSVIWVYVPAAGVSCAATEGAVSEEDTTAVWLDIGNEIDMTDPNSVIHGYGMEEGDGLYGLLNYGDADVMDEDPYVYIYTEETIREYRVFAAYEADTENILVNHNCYYQDAMIEYLYDIFNQRSMTAVVNADLEEYVQSIRKLLTFQVSVADGEDWIVQAVPTGVLVR